MQRRTFFGLVGAGAATAAMWSGAHVSGIADRARSGDARSTSLEFLFAPLVGRPLSLGYRLESVSEVELGSARVTLVGADGARAIVQVFRRSQVSSGLASTRLLDLRWMNGADGAAQTHEQAGLAVMGLAARLRRVETAALEAGLSRPQRTALRALQTHEQRLATHGGFVAMRRDSAEEERA
ncbi:MAG: hypothetical protein U0234_20935 [Sandaracinus sp.]